MTQIIISTDNDEGAEFAAYLQDIGYDARVGESTGNYVNGAWTSEHPHAQRFLNDLWDDYCRNAPAC